VVVREVAAEVRLEAEVGIAAVVAADKDGVGGGVTVEAGEAVDVVRARTFGVLFLRIALSEWNKRARHHVNDEKQIRATTRRVQQAFQIVQVTGAVSSATPHALFNYSTPVAMRSRSLNALQARSNTT
jgi:uncharacterized membrane protein